MAACLPYGRRGHLALEGMWRWPSYLYSPTLSYSQGLCYIFLTEVRVPPTVHPLLYYRPRLTNSRNGMEGAGARGYLDRDMRPRVKIMADFRDRETVFRRTRDLRPDSSPDCIPGRADFRQCNGEWRNSVCRIALHVPDSPDYILGKGRISDNAMEMELPTPVPGSRARGKGILNTWLPASNGDNGDGEHLLTQVTPGRNPSSHVITD